MTVDVEPPQPAVPTRPTLERMAERLTFSDASELLDALESQGIGAESVETAADGTLTIRWTLPA